jgi:hypothetical protein
VSGGKGGEGIGDGKVPGSVDVPDQGGNAGGHAEEETVPVKSDEGLD